MNVKRYDIEALWTGYAVYYSAAISHKEGEYVKYEDYKYLMGVVKKLRTKLEKKDRRSRKFRGYNGN